MTIGWRLMRLPMDQTFITSVSLDTLILLIVVNEILIINSISQQKEITIDLIFQTTVIYIMRVTSSASEIHPLAAKLKP